MSRWLLYRAAKHRAETLQAESPMGANLALIWKIATNREESYSLIFKKELLDEYEAYCKEVV